MKENNSVTRQTVNIDVASITMVTRNPNVPVCEMFNRGPLKLACFEQAEAACAIVLFITVVWNTMVTRLCSVKNLLCSKKSL